MRRLFISAIACFMLFAVTNVFAQGNSEGKGKAHDMIYICHNGMVIEVNAASWDAHEAHGDTRAIPNADGTWECPPCEPDYSTMPDPIECPDGTLERALWDFDTCEWYYPDCETGG